MLQDLRHAARGLLRTPGFTLVAVLTLALGIGATSSMFTVVNRVVLDPLPFPHADRLVLVWGSKPHEGQLELPFSQPDFEDLRAGSRSYDSLAAWAQGRGNVTGQTEPEQVQFAVVTGNFFDVLGVRPALGRTLTAAEERPGTPPVALINANPLDGRLLRSKVPPCSSVSCLASGSPRPVPWYLRAYEPSTW